MIETSTGLYIESKDIIPVEFAIESIIEIRHVLWHIVSIELNTLHRIGDILNKNAEKLYIKNTFKSPGFLAFRRGHFSGKSAAARRKTL